MFYGGGGGGYCRRRGGGARPNEEMIRVGLYITEVVRSIGRN